MTRGRRLAFLLTASLCAAPDALVAQSATGAAAGNVPRGGVTGVVTASRANGEAVKAANVLVHLWGTDATTTALRDSACAAWQTDKTAWLQAKQELESPSGMNLAGTPVGRDLALLSSLAALPHDTVRTGSDGAFTFQKVAAGMYTLGAEVYANNMFLQWSKDTGVLPKVQTHADLEASALGENQYCTVTTSGPETAKIYDTNELDEPLRPLSPYAAVSDLPGFRKGSVTIRFVVDENGVPGVETVRVTGTASVSVADARNAVAMWRFSAPRVHGRPVKARAEIVITAIMETR